MATSLDVDHPSTEKTDFLLKAQPMIQGELDILIQGELDILQSLFPGSLCNVKNVETKDLNLTVFVPLSVGILDVEVYFHLSPDYPLKAPEIFLLSKELSKSETKDVLKSLDLICLSSLGQPVLMCCIEEAVTLLRGLRSHGENLKLKDKKKKKKKKTNERSSRLMEDKGELNGSDNEFDQHNDAKNNLHDDGEIEIIAQGVNTLPVSVQEAKPLRPNYFIAIRIYNEMLIKNLENMQKALVEQEALLTKGAIPPSAFHVTLCNLGLDLADDLLRAMEALRKSKCELQQVLPRSPLVIHGASQFYDRAIYAKVKSDESFLQFRSFLLKKLSESGVEFREDHEQYTPHVTVIKVRRPERRMFGNRPIRPQIYSSFLDSVHGEQVVDALYLCAMDGNKREDGFYVTPYELQFEKQYFE